MTEKKTIRIRVSGRVQGVGYRWFARSIAHKLALHGTVENLSNGDVEIYVTGPPETLDTFLDSLKQGPPRSHVFDLDVETLPEIRAFSSFSIEFNSDE
jgi:acylphosphatase